MATETLPQNTREALDRVQPLDVAALSREGALGKQMNFSKAVAPAQSIVDIGLTKALRVFMLILRTLLAALTLLAANAFSQDITLLPKFGAQAKNDAQKAADEGFFASIDGHYKGDRKKAAEDVAARGWQFLRQGNAPDAMRRFNQAWLLDNSNGSALWGMAAFEAESGKLNESLTLFAEADRIVSGNIDFAADYAKALGIAGAQTKNESMLNDAFNRFASVYEKAPQHTLNIQNWAITLFYVGNFAEAWKKVQLAEATPRRAELDPRFLNALQSKMPRP